MHGAGINVGDPHPADFAARSYGVPSSPFQGEVSGGCSFRNMETTSVMPRSGVKVR